MSAEFDTKPVNILDENNYLKFNSAIISCRDETYLITQPGHFRKLTVLDVNNATKADYVAEQALAAYIAVIYRSDATYAFSITSQITDPQKKDIKNLNKMITTMLSSLDKGNKFVPFDLNSLVMAVFVDAGFASNPLVLVTTRIYNHADLKTWKCQFHSLRQP